MDHLKDMGLFVEVARAKSFRRAANTLNMPSSTLSRRIHALERAIGLRLFNRTTRRIELTEAGQIYFERSKRIVDEARLAHEQLGEIVSQPRGTLRVSLPVDFASIFLAPHLPEFVRRYPGIDFHMDLTPRRVDLVTEPFDVAVRMGELPDSQLIAHKISDIPRYLYASRAYLNAWGSPRKPADLAQHQCLLFPGEHEWTLQHKKNGPHTVQVHGAFHLNNVGMMQRLATEGLGIAMLSQESVDQGWGQGQSRGPDQDQSEDPRQLQRILPAWQGKPIAVHAITETRLLPAKTQRFIEYLKACLG